MKQRIFSIWMITVIFSMLAIEASATPADPMLLSFITTNGLISLGVIGAIAFGGTIIIHESIKKKNGKGFPVWLQVVVPVGLLVLSMFIISLIV